MIDTAEALAQARTPEGFQRPLYDTFGFARLPQTVRWLLAGAAEPGLPADLFGGLAAEIETVVLLFIDSLGWEMLQPFLEEPQAHPFLGRCRDHGVSVPITTLFPSTTAAHVTAIHTGLTPSQSGIYEWTQYEPLLDRLIHPLRFTTAGPDAVDLAELGMPPRMLLPRRTLYHDLRAAGVCCHVFGDVSYARSPFSLTVTDGATPHPYKGLPHALAELGQLLEDQPGKAYYLLYFDRVDSTCHQFGPGSAQARAEIAALLATLEAVLVRQILEPLRQRGRLRPTLVLLTADHGQAAVDPRSTIYLNQEQPDLVPFVRTNRDGRHLTAGSPRDLFLYVVPDQQDRARMILQDLLHDRAAVWPVADLRTAGFFGTTPPTRTFLGRMGDLVVLPRPGLTVGWWAPGEGSEMRFQGHHGGLSPAEMVVPLLALRYG